MVLACFAMLSTWCKAHVSSGLGPTVRKHVELISLTCKRTTVPDLLIDEIKALLRILNIANLVVQMCHGERRKFRAWMHY